jgi:hypothetical protein
MLIVLGAEINRAGSGNGRTFGLRLLGVGGLLRDPPDGSTSAIRCTCGSPCARPVPKIVFHLAAQALVGDGYRDPAGRTPSTPVGRLNLIEALRASPACPPL